VNSSNFSLSGGQAGSPHTISVIPGLRSRYSAQLAPSLHQLSEGAVLIASTDDKELEGEIANQQPVKLADNRDEVELDRGRCEQNEQSQDHASLAGSGTSRFAVSRAKSRTNCGR
jgi:hypothetical protein